MEKLSTMTYALTVTTPDLVFLWDASIQYKSEEKRKKNNKRSLFIVCKKWDNIARMIRNIMKK